MTAANLVSRPPPTILGRVTPFLAHLPVISNKWLVLGFGAAAEEPSIARYGAVEVRRTAGGLCAQTRVKGEQEQALATALQRVRQFLCKNQRSGLDIRLQRPLVQSEEARGRWVVRMGLIGLDEGIVSPASRGGRVRVVFTVPETVATLRVGGRATTGSVRCATARMLDLLETTPWTAIGEPFIRFQDALSVLPFLGYFEVAVPVSKHAPR
jgi:SOUL heme-binding protein